MNYQIPCDIDWISVHGPNIKNPLIGYEEELAAEFVERLLSAPNTEDLYKIDGKKYYFSSKGDDLNDGLTPDTPKKSLEILDELELCEGDGVLFERNSVFRVKQVIFLRSGVTYGSYGEGEKPRFYASLKDYAVSEYWKTTENENVWKTEFLEEEACGIIFDHGKEIGILWRKGIDYLKKNFDYHYDYENRVVYLYYDRGNPADFFKSIEIPYKLHIMFRLRKVNNVVVDNLCIKFAGGFGIAGSGENVTVTNCEMGYIGGLWSPVFKVRYGNAIEFGDVSRNIQVKNNWIYETFDTAVTWQGGTDKAVYENIEFSDNLLEYNNADIEFFTYGKSVVDNFFMENNIMRFTSNGWGTHEEERKPRLIEGCIRARTDQMERIGRIEYNGNIMDCPSRQIFFWRMLPENRKTISASNNKLNIKASYRTTDNVLIGFSDTAENTDTFFYADNAEDMKMLMDRLEKGMEVHWYDE